MRREGGMNCKCECSPEIICYRIGLAADVIERRRSQRMGPARHEREREINSQIDRAEMITASRCRKEQARTE